MKFFPSKAIFGALALAAATLPLFGQGSLAQASLAQAPLAQARLILIVEDDAQDGLDHVDGHRTVALAVSPYTRRGSIDSTFYSQVSMVKTIELILGLPSMTIFDFIANVVRIRPGESGAAAI